MWKWEVLPTVWRYQLPPFPASKCVGGGFTHARTYSTTVRENHLNVIKHTHLLLHVNSEHELHTHFHLGTTYSKAQFHQHM
jgi:hypothetical protein